MAGFFKKLKQWKLRMTCSDCGKEGVLIDEYNIHCPYCDVVWDGKAEFEQQKILIKERNTVVALL